MIHLESELTRFCFVRNSSDKLTLWCIECVTAHELKWICFGFFLFSGLQYPGSELRILAFPAVLHLCAAIRGNQTHVSDTVQSSSCKPAEMFLMIQNQQKHH